MRGDGDLNHSHERFSSILCKFLFDLINAPDRTWNCDETVFCTAVASKIVLSKRGAKEVHRERLYHSIRYVSCN